MNLRTKALACLLAVWSAFSQSAAAEEFKLKGLTIGTTPTAACQGAEITDKFGDIIRRMSAQDARLKDMNTRECELQIDNFGGYVARTPAKLLFFEGRLIVVKIELEEVSMKAVADIVTALQDEYGKPKLNRSDPFTTHTWVKKNASLTSERTARSWDDNDLTVILRDDAAFKRYDALVQSNNRVMQDIVKRETRRSITN